jgi:oxygen-independent coproporphyrinogen III oxidase
LRAAPGGDLPIYKEQRRHRHGGADAGGGEEHLVLAHGFIRPELMGVKKGRLGAEHSAGMNTVIRLQPPVPPVGDTSLIVDPQLLRKYGGNGPRYTSYPTADRFHPGVTAERYVDAIHARNQERPAAPLSLYVHIPFCNTICYYCACNKVITKDHGRSAKYIKYAGREIEIVSALVEGGPKVEQLHWGGGTPTFLARDEMSMLMGMLRGHFAFAPDAEISIEVDPRTADAARLAHLAVLGFNRLSFGVQDFDADVQRAVNRIQSLEETRRAIDAARANGFRSVNIDLILGLPRQTVAGFARSLERVLECDPDRIGIWGSSFSGGHASSFGDGMPLLDRSIIPSPRSGSRRYSRAPSLLGA